MRTAGLDSVTAQGYAPPMTTAMEQPGSMDPVIEAYKKDIDRTLIRENLRLTPEERLLKLHRLRLLAEELRRAGDRLIR